MNDIVPFTGVLVSPQRYSSYQADLLACEYAANHPAPSEESSMLSLVTVGGISLGFGFLLGLVAHSTNR